MIIKKVPLYVDRDEFLTPFDRLFDKVVNSQFPNFAEEVGISFEHGAFPKVDVVDYDDCIVLVAELPAMRKDALKVEVEDGVLSISGDKHNLLEENARYIRRELKHSSFRRSFNLGEQLDEESVVATFENGILRVEIPKKEVEVPVKHHVHIIGTQ